MPNRIVAIPNGSLEEKTVALFAAAGWSIKREGRKALCDTDCPFVDKVFFTRPQAIPRLVSRGICDIGISGLDYVVEELCAHSCTRLVQLATLPYNKETNGPAKVVVCAQANEAWPPQDIPWVYSEYPYLTKQFFEETMSIPRVYITRSPGSTEGHVAIGEYQYGVCLVEQGKTMAANNLRIVAELLESTAVLITRRDKADDAKVFAEQLLNALTKEIK